jgi:multidrug efflux pump subunit AcrA (membrane-fusion protein)
MNTPTTFLYYAAETNEWQKTTLEELATLNDPDLDIIPIDESGNYGQQTTWAEYNSPEYQTALQQAARKAALDRENQQRRLQQLYDQQKAEQERQAAARQQQQLQQQAQQHQHTNLQEIRDEITNADIRNTCKLIRYLCRLICVTFWMGLVICCIALCAITAGEKYMFAGAVAGVIVAAAVIFVIELAICKWEDATAKSPNTPQLAQE